MEDIKNEINEEQIHEEQIQNEQIHSEQEQVTSQEKKSLEQEQEEPYTGPTVKIQTRYDFRTMKYFNMYNMVYRKHFQIVYIIMGLLSLGFAGYTIYTALAASATDMVNFVLPVIFALFGVYFIYQAICFEKVIDKNITMHFYKNPKVVNIEVTMTERDVTLQIVGGKNGEPFKYDWAYITEIVEIPQFFFLYVQKQPIIIEKDATKITEGDYETLVAMILEHAQTKPYKKIEKELVTKPITYVHQEDIEEEKNQDSFEQIHSEQIHSEQIHSEQENNEPKE